MNPYRVTTSASETLNSLAPDNFARLNPDLAIKDNDNKYILNPGSVGQPRDIGGLASYAIFDSLNYTFRFKRLPFQTNEIIETVESFDPTNLYLKDIMER